MPTYEYKCTQCGEVTSEFKPMSAPRRQRCPVCRCKVDLLITGGLGIVFKGEGFYVNDSRAASRSGARQGAEKSGGEPSGADSSRGDSSRGDSSRSDSSRSDRPADTKPQGAGSDAHPKTAGSGEKPVASRDGAVHDKKSTAKDKD